MGRLMSVLEKMTGITPVAFTCARAHGVNRRAMVPRPGLPHMARGREPGEHGTLVWADVGGAAVERRDLEGQVRLLAQRGVAVAAGVVHGDLALRLRRSAHTQQPLTGPSLGRLLGQALEPALSMQPAAGTPPQAPVHSPIRQAAAPPVHAL